MWRAAACPRLDERRDRWILGWKRDETPALLLQCFDFFLRALEDLADLRNARRVMRPAGGGTKRHLHHVGSRACYLQAFGPDPWAPVPRLIGTLPDALDRFGFARQFLLAHVSKRIGP